MITAAPGDTSTGPLLLLDQSKNLIKAKGSLEVFSNLIVFTPVLPLKEIHLFLNAMPDEVPGLLPDTVYEIYVPVGTAGSIANLKSIDPVVANPVSFKTAIHSQIFFSNFPEVAPEVVEIHPKNGRIDFPVNNLAVISGKAPYEGVQIGFDQPLLPNSNNLQGFDGDGDGLIEPNIFLRFSGRLLPASDLAAKGLFFLDRENPGEDPGATFKETQLGGGQPVSLSDITLNHAGLMSGLSNGVLYQVEYKTKETFIPLTQLVDTGYPGLKGLALGPDGLYYAVDPDTESLIRIDAAAPEVVSIGTIPSGDTATDLAFLYDGTLMLLRVEGQGGPMPMAYLEIVSTKDASTFPMISNLPGNLVSMTFVDRKTLYLIEDCTEEDSRKLITLDLTIGDLVEIGEIPWLSNGAADLGAVFYEMETDAHLVSNPPEGSLASINPKGMLPFGTEIEMMVRNRLKSISGFSRSDLDPDALPMASQFVAAFTTFDPGPDVLEDVFLETFTDSVFEDTSGELEKASASWNYQDVDGEPPMLSRLVATFGLGGSGELGDFLPLGVFPVIGLDTDYQPLPLVDGSTPNITEPLVVKGGQFNFRNITIPDGVSVFGRGSHPLVFTATGDVLIEGTIDVSGLGGGYDDAFDSGFIPIAGGLGGPSGGYGGMGQPPNPVDFTSVPQLETPTTGEHGWGPGNAFQIGGRGGTSGAEDPGPPFKGASVHLKSHGAGGAGGTFLLKGFPGVIGKGDRVPPDRENKNTVDGGQPGNVVFMDKDLDNDFFGTGGELSVLHGGQGGGGGGSRWDSLNPNAAGATPPGLPVCMWDAKGGGAGGGGGAVAIHALGKIKIAKTGRILARGGMGGGGEQVGVSNFGGAGGGGSGGVIILHSGQHIELEKDTDTLIGATLDVSGGRFGDAKESGSAHGQRPKDFCPEGKNPPGQFCTLSKGDGGQGGFGIIQLMVDEPDTDISPPPAELHDANVAEEIKVGATIWWADPDNKSPGGTGNPGYPYYIRELLTFQSEPDAYPRTFTIGRLGDPPKYYIEEFTVDNPPLVSPYRTVAKLSPKSFGLSKWIDLGGAIHRPLVGPNPGIPAPCFLGFQGTDPLTGLVLTVNGWVKNYHIPDWNDIVVEAPDLAEKNYIPDENEVRVEFQGAHAAAPGLSVPGDDRSDWTGDITTLSGYELIRFRVEIDVAKSGNLTLESTRPQVNFIRLRVQY